MLHQVFSVVSCWVYIVTLLTNKCKKHIDVIYLVAMQNVHTIYEYSWGDMVLAQLYHFVDESTHLDNGSIDGYMSLLIVKI